MAIRRREEGVRRERVRGEVGGPSPRRVWTEVGREAMGMCRVVVVWWERLQEF